MTGELFLRSAEVAAWVDRCAAWFPPVAPSAASDRALSAPLVSEQLHADIVRALSSYRFDSVLSDTFDRQRGN